MSGVAERVRWEAQLRMSMQMHMHDKAVLPYALPRTNPTATPHVTPCRSPTTHPSIPAPPLPPRRMPQCTCQKADDANGKSGSVGARSRRGRGRRASIAGSFESRRNSEGRRGGEGSRGKSVEIEPNQRSAERGSGGSRGWWGDVCGVALDGGSLAGGEGERAGAGVAEGAGEGGEGGAVVVDERLRFARGAVWRREALLELHERVVALLRSHGEESRCVWWGGVEAIGVGAMS